MARKWQANLQKHTFLVVVTSLVVFPPPVFPPKKGAILFFLRIIGSQKYNGLEIQTNPAKKESHSHLLFGGSQLILREAPFNCPTLGNLRVSREIFVALPGDAMLHQLSTSKQPKQVDDSKAPRAVDDTAASWMSFVEHVA